MTVISVTPCAPVLLVLDDGQATSLDALATSVAFFGAGHFELLYANDLLSLRLMAGELADLGAEALVVVDADHDPEPKRLLAEAAETGFPLAVRSDGRRDAIQGHAQSVGAAAYLPGALPARELIARLGSLPARREDHPSV
jgi:hypothetical protein